MFHRHHDRHHPGHGEGHREGRDQARGRGFPGFGFSMHEGMHEDDADGGFRFAGRGPFAINPFRYAGNPNSFAGL